MNEHASEQISAMIDGEIAASEVETVVNHIKQDPEAVGQWERYHLIGDVLNNNTPDQIRADLAGSVMERISGEAEIISLHPRTPTRLQGMTKQLIGLSIAASVAVVSLLTYENLIQPGVGQSAPSVATVPSEVVIEQPIELAQQKSQSNAEKRMLDQRINSYLVNHNEFALSNGMRGMPPYVRMVSQDKP